MSKLTLFDLAVINLQPTNFMVNAGECVCLTGPSGAGKSLLMRAIADLIPHQGDASLDDKLCSQMKPSIWRRQVGYLPAESSWWSDRVGDHFPEPPAEVFSQLGFDMEVLDWQISRLSTGEKQRLALARLLGNLPRVLLLDEPTASLDVSNVNNVENLLKAYQQKHNVALLWVSHNPEQIKRVADRVVQLRDGKVHEVSL